MVLKRFLPISILIIINLVIGGITYRSYGDSLDDAGLREYGSQSLDAYKSFPRPSYSFHYVGYEMQYYGPAYVMGVELIGRIFHLPLAEANTGDIWHFAFFISFLLGVVCLYVLGRRWMTDWAAIGITLLFSTQPLLWGHAFINPKDTPFMGFFLLSVATGFWMGDKIKSPDHEIKWIGLINQALHRIIQNYRDLPKPWKRKAGTITLIVLLSIVGLLAAKGLLNNWVAFIVQKANADGTNSLPGEIFLKLAQHKDTIPLEKYIHKAQVVLSEIKNIYFLLAVILIFWLYRACLAGFIHFPSKKALIVFLRDTGRAFITPSVIIAGIALGLTTSIRILGPMAGLIAGLFWVWKKGKNVLASLFAYAMIALIVMYFTWPYLWFDPVNHIIESIQVMSSFPWLGKVLFNGNYYASTNLPWSYIPELLFIQFSEPLVILFAAGLVISIYKMIHKKSSLFALSLFWFFLPVAYFIITRRPIYDNFRQLLFLVPPLFLISGHALDAIFRFTGKWWTRVIVLCILIFPGIYWCWNLHPYEYIYYNSFTGNVNGAYGKFEMDYWMTSFRETTDYLNRVALPNERAVVWGGARLVRQYARKDLIIDRPENPSFNLTGGYDYAILSSRGGQNEFYPAAKPVFIVERDGALLAIVKQLPRFSSP
jgi:hypothetical protein